MHSSRFISIARSGMYTKGAVLFAHVVVVFDITLPVNRLSVLFRISNVGLENKIFDSHISMKNEKQ